MKKLTCVLVCTLICAGALALKSPEYTDPNKPIAVSQASHRVTLKVKSNPSTGYRWFLRDYDSQFIMPVAHRFLAPQPHLAGASGIEIWTFNLRSAAFTVPHLLEIGLIYARPWDLQDSTRVKFTLITA